MKTTEQFFLLCSLLTVTLSVGVNSVSTSVAIQMKPFEQQMTLFIYLSHFKMKFRIILNFRFERLGGLKLCDYNDLMKYLNSDHPFRKP